MPQAVAKKAPVAPVKAPAAVRAPVRAPARAPAPAPAPARPAARAPAPAPAKAPVRAPAPARAPARAPAPAAPARAAAPARTPTAADGHDPNVAKMLKQMKQKWEAAKDESKKGGGGGTTASPGRHECRLTDARLVAPNGALACVLVFTVISGDDTGETCVRYDGLDTDDRIIYFQRDLRRLGLPVDDFDPEQLPQLCEELKSIQPLVAMNVREKDGYTNAYIDRLLDAGEVAEEPTEEVPAEEETPAEEAVAEEVAEEPAAEEAPAEEVGDLAIGDQVVFADEKNVEHTGEVTQIYDDNTADVKEDKNGKTVNVGLEYLTKLVAAE